MKVQNYSPGEREIQEAYERALIDSIASKLRNDGFNVKQGPNAILRVNESSDFLNKEQEWKFYEPDIIATKGDLKIAYIISNKLYSKSKEEFKGLIEGLKAKGYNVKYMLHKPPRVRYKQFSDIQTIIQNDNDISKDLLSQANSSDKRLNAYSFVYFDVTDVTGSFKSKSFTVSGTAVIRAYIKDLKNGEKSVSGDLEPKFSEDLHFEFRLDLSLDENSQEFYIEDYDLEFT